MIPVDAEQRDGQLCQALLFVDVPPSAIIVDARVAQDDHGVLPGGLYPFAESLNAAEFSVGVSCDVYHGRPFSVPSISMHMSASFILSPNLFDSLLHRNNLRATSASRDYKGFTHKISLYDNSVVDVECRAKKNVV